MHAAGREDGSFSPILATAPMLSFSDLTLRRGPRALIEHFSATVFAGQRVGVVGRNGTGKSSLFALVLGEITPDQGDVSLPRNLAIASVAQETPASPASALDYALDGDTELRAIERDLEAAEAAHDGMRIAELHERLGHIDGYAARARAAQLLHGLGFAPDEQDRPVATFSGGWRMRLNLARALMRRSDLLLLDEPTNHLDLDAVVWLQGWLLEYPGTLLAISHDREFLDAVTTHTLHLAQGTATLYAGNYSQFERQRAERITQQKALDDSQRRQIAHLQAFVDRFRAKASKARQAQSRLKMIERIERVAPLIADPEFEFEFPQPPKLPAPLLSYHDAAVGYAKRGPIPLKGHGSADGDPMPDDGPHAGSSGDGFRLVLSGIKVSLQPGDRIGLVGPNGAGKTTLVRLLAGELPAQSGDATRHPDLRVGYFAQHQLEQLDPAATALEHFQKLDPRASTQALRDFLGSFHFREQRVFEPVAPFSGGEKARLALAMVVYRKPNLLLLDEPTNHLDLEMREALEIALQDFAGALVLVSHDRHLVGTTCDDLWRVAEGTLTHFEGDLDDYATWLSQRERDWARRQQSPRAAAPAPKATPARAPDKALRSAVQRAERRVEKAQARLAEIETALAAPDAYAPARRAASTAMSAEQSHLRDELAKAEAEWLAAAEALEKAS
jgi:ATP-binding cassette subfamily F protein 3